MVLLTLAVAFILRVYLIIRDSIPFAQDMGRDLLWAKDIAFYHTPTLIGPAASIWGVYFGPLWFYFLSVPLWISGGNPLSAVYATATIIVITGAFSFYLFKHYLTKTHAFILAIIFLFGTTTINISTFAFHANVLPFLTVLMIYFIFLSCVKNPLFISLAFLSVGLMFHADPAPAVAFAFVPIFTLFYFRLHQSKNFTKVLTSSISLYFLPFLPQMLFEFRNNFTQTNSLIAYFTGQNPSLSGQLPLFERIGNRIFLYFEFFKASFAGGNTLFAVLFFTILLIGLLQFLKINKDKRLTNLLRINFFALFITFVIFTFVFTIEIKNWYLFGIVPLFAFFVVFGIIGLKKQKKIIIFVLVSYLIFNLLPFARKERINQLNADPAMLSNQLAAINLIYNDPKVSAFSVYTFTPSIYDFHYQYLFWWQGIKLQKGLPEDFAYLPKVPNYVRNKHIYAQDGKTNDLVYLMMENAQENEFYSRKNFLANFNDYQIVWERNINSAITVQKRLR